MVFADTPLAEAVAELNRYAPHALVVKDARAGALRISGAFRTGESATFAEALETVKCFDEGVITSVPDANIGSIFGIGFPAWTGGVVQYINQYEGGLQGFVDRARDLASKYGKHFEPPQSLVDKAAKGEKY